MASTERGAALPTHRYRAAPFGAQANMPLVPSQDGPAIDPAFAAAIGTSIVRELNSIPIPTLTATNGSHTHDPVPDFDSVMLPVAARAAISVPAGVTRHYRMLAKDSNTGLWLVPWVVTGLPDTTGAFYPGAGAVLVSSIRVIATWKT